MNECHQKLHRSLTVQYDYKIVHYSTDCKMQYTVYCSTKRDLLVGIFFLMFFIHFTTRKIYSRDAALSHLHRWSPIMLHIYGILRSILSRRFPPENTAIGVADSVYGSSFTTANNF